MAKILQKRTLSGWVPADAAAEAAWRKQKLDEVYGATVAKPRNYKYHCLFICLLEKTYENQDRFVSDRQFRRAVALAAGHTEEMMTMEGEILAIPLPYDYENLPDEDDFTKAFGAAMTVCASIVRLTAPDLEEEIARYANEQYGIECPRIFRESYRERAA